MENFSMKNLSLREIYNNGKIKRKDYDFAHLIICTCKLTCLYTCAFGWNSMVVNM